MLLNSNHLFCVVFLIQEALVLSDSIALAIRPRPGVWEYVSVALSQSGPKVQTITPSQYLQYKEEVVGSR